MRLVILEIPGLPPGTKQVTEFELKIDQTKPFYVVGRQLGSDIHLVDSSVSRKHAEITVRQEGILIRDLGSANGSFISEKRIQSYVETLARPGERVRFGNVVLSLEGGPLADYYSQETQVNVPVPPQAALSSQASYHQAGPAVAPSYAYLPQTEPIANPLTSPRPRTAPHAIPPASPVRNAAPARPQPAVAKKRSPILYALLGVAAGLVILGVVATILYLVVFSGLPQGQLPAPNFNSAAKQDRPLGLEIGRPTDWLLVDSGQNQVLYYPPNQTTTVLNIERPPSRTVPNNTVSPETAIKQYLANVKANATRSEVIAPPGTVKLRDGTPAVISRLVFSTNQAPVVTDYNMLVISFRCGTQLYFVSAAAEGANNSVGVRRDLDASIANLACAK